MTYYDVAIVGAGPAGLQAAHTLRNITNMSIMIIDANPLDYEKPCGGGLPIDCLKDFPYLEQAIKHKTTKIRAQYKNISREFPVVINMCPRKDMRKLQFSMISSDDRITITLCQRIDHVHIPNKAIYLSNGQHINYKWLIGADGVNSIVAKAIHFSTAKVPIVLSHLRSLTNNYPDEHISDIIFLDDVLGYFWIFPKGDHVNVGMGGHIKGKELRKRFETKLNTLIHNSYDEFYPSYYSRIYDSAHLIPFDYTPGPHYDKDNNIILCGDAASFVNQMTGEGIWFALTSGKEAAEVIAGTRNFADYPSFAHYLERVQALKDDIRNLPTGETFDQIFCGEESNDTVKFLFSHSIPQPRPLTDEEKKNIYDRLGGA